MTETASTSPRHPRRGLAIPFLVVGLLLAAWTGWWLVLTHQIETRLADQAESLRQQGWQVRYASVTTTGWPFRARVEIPHMEVIAPSGLGVAAPTLTAEANAYDPDQWVVLAPDGLTLTRPGKGKVGVKGEGLRLSVSHLRDRFPDLRVELFKPTFIAHPGAEPFPIASAGRIQFYARPHLTGGRAATDQMDVKFVLTDARGRSGGPVEGVTRSGMLSADIEATIDHASRLSGPDAAGLFANWTEAGGRFTAIHGELTAGESGAVLSSDQLSAGPDGRLRGQLALKADKPLPAIAGLARSGSGAVNRLGAVGAAAAATTGGQGDVALTLVFRDGRTWLGPFALAPAPKLF